MLGKHGEVCCHRIKDNGAGGSAVSRFLPSYCTILREAYTGRWLGAFVPSASAMFQGDDSRRACLIHDLPQDQARIVQNRRNAV